MRVGNATGTFTKSPTPRGPPFIICMPPPNVTGARAPGTCVDVYADGRADAIPSHARRERRLASWCRPRGDRDRSRAGSRTAAEGLRREDLGRERFVERAWEWSRTYGGAIDEQFRRLGFGPDWQRSRFTMDEGLSAAVRRVFVQLYRDGLIYRGTRLINWDPTGKTTVSDAELEHVERDGTLWRVRYPFSKDDSGRRHRGRDDATGDDACRRRHRRSSERSAICRPGRPQRLACRRCSNAAIPIVADDAVDPEFGTGAVKVTPAHDPTDYEIGAAPPPSNAVGHRLRCAITGADVDVGSYAGLDRFEARARIVDDLRARSCPRRGRTAPPYGRDQRAQRGHR